MVEPTPAQAVAAAVELSWTVPPDCPDAARVREGIASMLGRAPNVSAASDVKVVASIADGQPGAAPYRLQLEITTPSGRTTKAMSGAQCEVLADATALISAIAIDPSAVLDATEPAPEPDVTPKPEPVEPEPDRDPLQTPATMDGATGTRRQAPPAATGDPRAASKVLLVRFAMQGFGGLDVATLPGVSGALGGLGAVFGPRWRAEVTGLVLLPRTGFAADQAGARIGMFAFGGRGCWTPTVRVVEVPLCGGAEAGLFRGDPTGARVANPITVREPYLAGLGSAGVAWAPRPFFALVARGELVVPILRPGFAIGQVIAHRIPAATGRFFVGVEARFP